MLSKLYGYLLGAGGLVLALLAALGFAKRSGVKEAQAEATEASLEASKKGGEIDQKVLTSSDKSVADGLSKYTRQ